MLALFFAAALASCTKRDSLDTPAFTVKTDKATYKKGDSVIFRFDGEPDIITFWSGERGAEYQFRNRTVMTGGVPNLSFSSRVLYGGQANNFHVMVSTDFSGTYTPAGIQAATWKEISSRFTLATAALNAIGDETQSGVSDISDLVEKGKPLFIAYKYTGTTPVDANDKMRTWRVMSFNLNAKFPDGTSASVANIGSAGWIAVDVLNPVNFWKISSTLLDFPPNSATDPSEDWVISKPFNISTEMPVSPDKGLAIKEFNQRKPEHVYQFAKAGTYKVAFVASNTNAKGMKTVVKELEIKIED